MSSRPNSLDRALHHRLHLRFVGDVDLDGHGAPVGLGRDVGGHLLGAVQVQVGHHHVRPLAGQPVADRLAQPLRAAGDQGDPVSSISSMHPPHGSITRRNSPPPPPSTRGRP